MNKIIKDIMSKKLTREIDEKGSGGVWDVAGDIAYSFNNKIMEENDCQDLQESIYNTLWETIEELTKENEQQQKLLRLGIKEAIKKQIKQLEKADIGHLKKEIASNFFNQNIKKDQEAIDFIIRKDIYDWVDFYCGYYQALNDLKRNI